jgi:hypothetical protein
VLDGLQVLAYRCSFLQALGLPRRQFHKPAHEFFQGLTALSQFIENRQFMFAEQDVTESVALSILPHTTCRRKRGTIFAIRE